MTRVLVLTADVLRVKMAGPAIRAWEISRELSKNHEVRLVSVSGVPAERSSDDFEVHSIWKDRFLRPQVSWADVVIVQGMITTEFPWILRTPVKLVVDLYDPMHLEMLEQTVGVPLKARFHMVSAINDTLNVQISRADFMMCASQKQKDFWLGQLMANGRLNPYTYDHSGTLESLLAVVPFGLSSEEPSQSHHGLLGAIPGVERNDEVIIWGGGIYNWFDPLTLIRAMVLVVEQRPQARLFFMGSGHPNPDVPQMSIAREAYMLAKELGLLDSTVFFNEGWVPYEDRANFLLDAKVGVSTHKIHLETEFSFRTRILDYLWSNLPIISTAGDGFAQIVESRGLGRVVSEGNVCELADAILEILRDDELRAAIRSRVAEVAIAFRWDAVLRPLVAFVDCPRHAPDRFVKKRIWHATRTTRAFTSSIRHSRIHPLYKFIRRLYNKARKSLGLAA